MKNHNPRYTIIHSASVLVLVAMLSPTLVPRALAGAGPACEESTGLECGTGSSTGSASATAIGGDGTDADALGAQATGSESVAIGADALGTGSESVALGYNAQATTTETTAIGESTTASGTGAVALGTNANATATRAHALGRNSDATLTSALAVGANTQATGLESIAIGSGAGILTSARSTGTRSIAIGGGASGAEGAQADGSESIAIGNASDAVGNDSVAIGSDGLDGDSLGAQATGIESIAIGPDAVSGFDGAIAIGAGATTTEIDEIVLGVGNRLTIKGNKRAGFGTGVPLAPLDVLTDGANIGTGNAVIWLANSAGPTAFTMDPGDDGVFWNTSAPANSEYRISRSGTGGPEFTLQSNGNLDIRGTLTTGGPSCGGGCDAVFNSDYELPSIEEHAEAMFTNKHLPAVGPTLPHQPIDLTEHVGNMLNELEKAHIYIAELSEEKKLLLGKMEHQQATLIALTARLEALESRVAMD